MSAPLNVLFYQDPILGHNFGCGISSVGVSFFCKELGDEISSHQAVYCHRGPKTSVSLEEAFWKGLKEIAGGRAMTLSDLVAAIDAERQHGNLSSAIRLFVLNSYRDQISADQGRPNEQKVA
jgi:predicted DNA-binding ribbon-helix-helix protein